MADFNIRTESVDVEQIMRQIRARIREKRGVDYTEAEIQELAAVKLEKFLDPKGVRSDLLEHFRRSRVPISTSVAPPENYAFEDTTLFDSHRAVVRWIRLLLRPILKLFFNPNPLIHVLHLQSRLNARALQVEEQQEQRERQRAEIDALYYEVMHNLVVELTRLGIELKNLKMRVESLSSRLDFDERRARALEGVVQYRPGVVAARPPPASVGEQDEEPAPAAETITAAKGEAQRRRRRRRRGRRGGAGAAAISSGPEGAPTGSEVQAPSGEAGGAPRAESSPADQASPAAPEPSGPQGSTEQ